MLGGVYRVKREMGLDTLTSWTESRLALTEGMYQLCSSRFVIYLDAMNDTA